MQRFPELAKMFSLQNAGDIPEDIPPHLVAPIEILQSKQGIPTAKDGGKFLHSAYNPLREAEQAAKAAKSSISDCYATAFFSFGLGYTAIEYAKLFPNDTIILIESDPRYFFTALSLVDWSPLFSHANFIIALGTGIDAVVSLIEQTGGLNHTAISENASQSAHSADYFKALHSLIERNKRKVEINSSTLEKFSKLWLKNTCRNLHFLAEKRGITALKNSCPKDLPCVILAAGPTLQELLPHLAKIKKRAILIAVDTALRACLRAGVEPDFIVLADPQYYAWRHIAGLSSPSSILITESAAYPAVFRFQCKEIIMCASLFPLGQYIEKQIGSKGALIAGGSVSTTAWDFARFIGANEIFCAGLDLGYPAFQTHIKGSTFEENLHAHSGRLSPAEYSGSRILFSAGIKSDKAYDESEILTDGKMKMFAWWFESKQEEFKESIKSYTLSPKSLKIPGFLVASAQELLSRSDKSAQKETFFETTCGGVTGADLSKNSHTDSQANQNEQESAPVEGGVGATKCDAGGSDASLTSFVSDSILSEDKTSHSPFYTALENLKNGLEELYSVARKGARTADEGIKSINPQKFIPELAKIDAKILNSEYKEIASLVFPNEKKLAALIEKLPPLADEVKSSLQKSKLIYSELMKSIAQYKKFLP